MNFYKKAFLVINIVFFTFWAALFLDFFKGDANGMVAGVRLLAFAKSFTIIYFIFSFWYAFKFKVAALQNLFMSLTMTALLLFLIEWACGFVLKKQSTLSPKIEGPTHSMLLDPILGYKPEPNATHKGIRTKDGEIIYSIAYQTDQHSLRITPIDSAKKTQYAQFYGCSMTFGEGVQSNETIPFYYGKRHKAIRPYNFAYSGYGPSQMLARLTSDSLQNIVKEKDGKAYFIYINDHVNRVIGSMTNYSYNEGHAPYYCLEKGNLKSSGLFFEGRRLKSLIYSILLKSNLLKLFKVGIPIKLSEADYALTAEVIAKAAKKYKETFGNDNFSVVIYPSKNNNRLIIKHLKLRKIKIIDLSKLFDPLDHRYAIPFDQHPTAQANELLIEHLN